MRSWVPGAAIAAMVMVAGVAGVRAGQVSPPREPPKPPVQRPVQPSSKPAAPKPAQPVVNPLLQVHTNVSRTVALVGDPIIWTVEMICAPTVDVIADDMAADKLRLVGLEVVGSTTERETRDDGGVTHRVKYDLRTYEVGVPLLKSAGFTVRYFVQRPGQRAEDIATAGEVQVPGIELSWRSTIPEGIKEIDLRRERPAESMPAVLRLARPIGLALVVVAIAPVGVWGASKLRKVRRPKERRPSLRASRKEARKSLENVRLAGTTTEEERRDAFGQLGLLLRKYVTEISTVPAVALTAEEVGTRFLGRRGRPSGEEVGKLLAECDRACYGPAETLPSADQFRETVDSAERLL